MFPLRKFVSWKRGVWPNYGLQIYTCQRKTLVLGTVTYNKTMKDVKRELIRILQSHDATTPKSIKVAMELLPKSQEDIPVRKVKDSFDTAIIPLSKNLQLRERYTMFLGHLRLGKLMEDIDLFAAAPAREDDLTEPGRIFQVVMGRSVQGSGIVRRWKELGRWMRLPFLVTSYNSQCYTAVYYNPEPIIVWCCIKHINPTPAEDKPFPYIIVTIGLDDVKMKNRLHQPLWDVRLSGHVGWVGKSSLEVVVWLDQEVDGKWEPMMKAFLLMAARNPANTGPAIINSIQAESVEEKELLEGGEQRRQRRQKMMKESLLREVPAEEELHLIHSLFKKTLNSNEFLLNKKVLPPKSRWMKDATLSNLVFCHPENRNMYNKIFGGFLMRQALELSWSAAFVHGMRVPKLIHISDIRFYKPVDVGSALKLDASVNYAEKNFIQVSVYSEAFTFLSQEGSTTNSFNFTYDLGTECDILFPLSYLAAKPKSIKELEERGKRPDQLPMLQKIPNSGEQQWQILSANSGGVLERHQKPKGKIVIH